MPIYEYRCPNGHTFELFQRMSDAPVEVCQHCGAGPVEKVLFPVAVHFKGSGFYSTDYGRAGRKSEKDGESAAATKKDSAPASSGDGGSADKGSGSTGAGDKGSGGGKTTSGSD